MWGGRKCRIAGSGTVRQYPTVTATCQLVYLLASQRWFWNSALKKAYIITGFFILRFITVRGSHKAAVLHPQFIDWLPVPWASTEKYYHKVTFPIYCFNSHDVFHYPSVVSDGIRFWRLVESDIGTFLSHMVASLIIIIITSWAFAGYQMKSIRRYSGAKKFRKIVLTYQNSLKTKRCPTIPSITLIT